MKTLCMRRAVLAFLLAATAVASEGLRADEEVWTLTEYRAGEDIVRIGDELYWLTPDAAKSLAAQLERLGPRAPGRHSVSLAFGQGPRGRRLITEILVLR